MNQKETPIGSLRLWTSLSVGLMAIVGLFILSEYQKPASTNNIEQAELFPTAPAVPNPPPSRKKIQLALILDTSNSMDGLIEQAKSQLWEVVMELSKARHDGDEPQFFLSLYEYGNSHLPANQGYLRQVVQLTTDLDQVSEALFSLTTNGGSEYCGTAIKRSLDELAWEDGDSDLKLIFIAGNEGFDQGSDPYAEVCHRAREKGIYVNTIFCGDYQQGIRVQWQNGAMMGGGKYMNLDHNHIQQIQSTPFDDQLLTLNQQLNATYVAYGKRGISSKSRQLKQDDNAQQYGSYNYANRIISKSSSFYDNGSWDLVDASQGESFDLAQVEQKHLPKTMQEMSFAQQEAYIAQKRQERQRIKAEIAKVDQQRRAYLTNLKQSGKSAGGGLQGVMVEAIHELAAKKALTFDS